MSLESPETVSFIPSLYYLRACSGASLAFALEVRHEDGSPFDLTGYTIEAPLTVRSTGEPAPVPAFTQTVAATAGSIHLSLSSEETVQLLIGTTWPWAVWLRNDTLDTVLAHGDLAFSRA